MYYWWFKNFNKNKYYNKFIEKINNLIIVGAMANNFFIYKNFESWKIFN